jgi:hypothetical protein
MIYGKKTSKVLFIVELILLILAIVSPTSFEIRERFAVGESRPRSNFQIMINNASWAPKPIYPPSYTVNISISKNVKLLIEKASLVGHMNENEGVRYLPPGVNDGSNDYEINITQFPNVSKSTSPKIESYLDQIARALIQENKDKLSELAPQCLVQGSIRVIIELQNSSSLLIEELKNCTQKIELIYDNMVQALVSPSQIYTLSNLSYVKFIRTPLVPLLCHQSEGVGVIRADKLHAKGITGKNVKVAILDLGFKDYKQKLGTELPNQVIIKSFRSDGDIEAGEDHGTACAEVVHDVAPDAILYLVNFGTDVEFQKAVDWLINQGVNVISHSIGWVNIGGYDGTGPICDAVNKAKKAGILFVTAAGNNAKRHWEGVFRDSDNDGWLNFGDSDETINIWAYRGQVIEVFLSWPECWPTTYEDYDLYLYDKNMNMVASSTTGQYLWPPDPPTEVIRYTATYDGYYHIAVRKYSTSRDWLIEIYSFSNDFLDHNVESSSLLIPADAEGAIAVGATYYSDDSLESYSSRGPTNDGRIKPDVTGPDGVDNSVYGAFYGTSASTPHVAGAAALLIDYLNKHGICALPEYLKEVLEKGALDLGPSGKDNSYGSGRINVYKSALHLDMWPPQNPNSYSSSHEVGVWSNDNTIYIKWYGASDDLSVYGYSYEWSQSSDTVPDNILDTIGTETISPPLSDGSNWYFHVRTVDEAGNWNSNAFHVGPFKIDTSAPSAPSISSPTHPDSDRWYVNNDPTFSWSTPPDLSGVIGYSFVLDKSSSTIPDTTIDTTANSISYTDLEDGIWYFHIRAKDRAGNWGPASHYRIKIDTTPPAGVVIINGNATSPSIDSAKR